VHLWFKCISLELDFAGVGFLLLFGPEILQVRRATTVFRVAQHYVINTKILTLWVNKEVNVSFLVVGLSTTSEGQ
jgi:hypothetical protein